MTPSQDLSSRVLCERTLRVSPPPRAEFDCLVAKVSKISLTCDQGATLERDVEQKKQSTAHMESGIDYLMQKDSENDDQKATVSGLVSLVTKLTVQNAELMEQIRSSGATAQLAQSTQSLPSFIFPVRSSSPTVAASPDGLDESSLPHPRWSRTGGNLRPKSQCKPPKRLW